MKFINFSHALASGQYGGIKNHASLSFSNIFLIFFGSMKSAIVSNNHHLSIINYRIILQFCNQRP